jgi:hypothetical protein
MKHFPFTYVMYILVKYVLCNDINPNLRHNYSIYNPNETL